MEGLFEHNSFNITPSTATTTEGKAAPTAQGTSFGQNPRLVVTKLIISAAAAQQVTVKSGSTTIMGPINILAGDTVDLGNLILKCNVREALNFTTANAVATTIYGECGKRA